MEGGWQPETRIVVGGRPEPEGLEAGPGIPKANLCFNDQSIRKAFIQKVHMRRCCAG